MRTANVAFVAALFLLGLPSRPCRACSTPRIPPDLTCVGFVGNSLIVQLGTIFQTSTPHSCAAAIALLGPPAGLNFSTAEAGKVNILTNAFTPTFILNRFPGSDGPWATGTDIHGTQPLPGATWFGFSNLAVPPITPPVVGPDEILAMRFTIAGPFDPTMIEDLRAQYGSGVGTAMGQPDFNHLADPAHSAQYSGVVTVPAFGTNNWAVPEPATYVCAIAALSIFAGRSWVRRVRPFGLGRGRHPYS